ncbi:DNA polymerase III subunit delta [Candidatus Uhrbacteria bacterium RIFCSPHIGHO2_01_FULL_63_20]|uniref:DNA polymerase III subunit delta n=1 Tax=Candidatus Uhrbacteria bacterium RIFCSPHIGHO2_01_FULL_63_20 TaxID=1802385 RepID=A0A1F7TM57_9BACT|nr:MAG: DNA polymerase III subunit delta [Candidatus Uhrbacteria bacterium RIFCSPHIGHO2_01_FULL_63_20]
MLIIVYGEDSFRVQEKVRTLTEAFRKKFDPSGMNLATFGSPSTGSGHIEIGEVMQSARSMPFMGEKRMVVVRDLISKSKKGDEETWAALKEVPDSTIAVLWESDEAKTIEKKPLFKALKDAADLHLYPFPALEGSALTKWVTERVVSRGGKIAPAAAFELSERVGGDLWHADAEICKLVAFANQSQIDVAHVRELVRPSFEGEIFAFIDAVSQRNGKEAFRLLSQERSAGSEDHYLLAMLARQIRILLGVRAMMDENPRVTKDEIANELALHPFVAQKSMAAAKRFTLPELMRAHDAIFEREVGVKSGMDPAAAVDLMAAELSA